MAEPSWTSREILFALSDEYGPDGVDIHGALMDHLRKLRGEGDRPEPGPPGVRGSGRSLPVTGEYRQWNATDSGEGDRGSD